VRKASAQWRQQLLQFLNDTGRTRIASRPQATPQQQARASLKPEQRMVQVLVVPAVKERELLCPVRRIVRAVQILKTPVRSPQANAFCERVIGTIRRECLDWMIPLNESHLRRVLQQWVGHYNRGRPHTSLGPGIPDAPDVAPVPSGHRTRDGHRVAVKPILGGLHHEYRLERPAA